MLLSGFFINVRRGVGVHGVVYENRVIIDDPSDSGCGQVVDSNYTGIIQGVRYGGWDFRSRGSLW